MCHWPCACGLLAVGCSEATRPHGQLPIRHRKAGIKGPAYIVSQRAPATGNDAGRDLWRPLCYRALRAHGRSPSRSMTRAHFRHVSSDVALAGQHGVRNAGREHSRRRRRGETALPSRRHSAQRRRQCRVLAPTDRRGKQHDAETGHDAAQQAAQPDMARLGLTGRRPPSGESTRLRGCWLWPPCRPRGLAPDFAAIPPRGCGVVRPGRQDSSIRRARPSAGSSRRLSASTCVSSVARRVAASSPAAETPWIAVANSWRMPSRMFASSRRRRDHLGVLLRQLAGGGERTEPRFAQPLDQAGQARMAFEQLLGRGQQQQRIRPWPFAAWPARSAACACCSLHTAQLVHAAGQGVVDGHVADRRLLQHAERDQVDAGLLLDLGQPAASPGQDWPRSGSPTPSIRKSHSDPSSRALDRTLCRVPRRSPRSIGQPGCDRYP